MKKIGLNELRKMFREFYVSKEHFARESFPLVPESDKSLLLINSGMAPLKPYFAGIETPPSKRMTTCQKCIRTGDLENVGHTARHGTFFEMLGSFSFGDYFKRESLTWGWEFVTKVLEMPVDKLWASIYEEDDEAYEIWTKEVGIDPSRVVRMGKDDNFWEIGTGPCGPCSEIYFDRGEKHGCGKPDCRPGCECDRYVEFWNHVFTQFDSDGKGNYTPLAHPNIDTGMGLERIACILQDTDSIFDVDTMRHILEEVCSVSGVAYQNGAAPTDVSIRIITDHLRSIVFLIGDGVVPSNEGRGYVLRRLLRRAAVHGKKLGINGEFLYLLADKVVEVSGEEYVEIVQKQDYIKRIIKAEEERFAQTIDQGLALLESNIRKLQETGKKLLPGDTAFFLYDTLGLNPELIKETLADAGLSFDEESFMALLRNRQENSRQGQKTSDDEAWRKGEEIFANFDATEFTGYESLQNTIFVKGIVKDGAVVESAEVGESIWAVFDKTPFYAEGGGQAADKGSLANENFSAQVKDVRKSGVVFAHALEIEKGSLKVGDNVEARVLAPARHKTARNHTATHLLHSALTNILGDHIKQAGSAVDENMLRFDFTHYEALTREQIRAVEREVNNALDAFEPVKTTLVSVDEAKARGAKAQFGEKYGEKARLVEVGDYSAELCGGTHVANSGEIGGFKIISESSVGSGARRIEAITGTNIANGLIFAQGVLDEIGEFLSARPENLKERILALQDELQNAKKALSEAKKEKAGGLAEELIAAAETLQTKEAGELKLVLYQSAEIDAEGLRELSDKLKAAAGNAALAAVLLSTEGEKLTIIVSLTDDLVSKGLNAGKIVKDLAALAGGGGGGKANLAQAGAKDPAKAAAVLEGAKAYFSK